MSASVVAWKRNPTTGDLVVLNGRRVRSDAPMREVVINLLNTDRGTHLPDPSRGLDYGLAQKALPTTPAAWRAAILEVLRPLTEPSLITQLRVDTEVDARGLRSLVEFHDPQSDTNPQRVEVRS